MTEGCPLGSILVPFGLHLPLLEGGVGGVSSTGVTLPHPAAVVVTAAPGTVVVVPGEIAEVASKIT